MVSVSELEPEPLEDRAIRTCESPVVAACSRRGTRVVNLSQDSVLGNQGVVDARTVGVVGRDRSVIEEPMRENERAPTRAFVEPYVDSLDLGFPLGDVEPPTRKRSHGLCVTRVIEKVLGQFGDVDTVSEMVLRGPRIGPA